METLLLLFLLVALDKDLSLKDALRGFLGFYKENRELISTVLKQGAAEAAAPAAPQQPHAAPNRPQQPPEAEKESRPERTDSLRILEEYLKRCEI